MEQFNMIRRGSSKKGMSLLEGVVVTFAVVVFGLIAAPKVRNTLERETAFKAYQYLASVRASQERYQASQKVYAGSLEELGMTASLPENFHVGSLERSIREDGRSTWKLTLTRKGMAMGFGAYTISFDQDGFLDDMSSVSAFPKINPMINN
jgi:Tfp pilus assembly protein PilE